MANIPKYMKNKYIIYCVDGSIFYANELSKQNNYCILNDVVMIQGDDRVDILDVMVPYTQIKYVNIK